MPRHQTQPIPELIPVERFSPLATAGKVGCRIGKTLVRAVHRPADFVEDWLERPAVYLTTPQLLVMATTVLGLTWHVRDTLIGAATVPAAETPVLGLLSELATSLVPALFVLCAILGLYAAGLLYRLPGGSLARASRVYAMNATMACVTIPAIAGLDVVAHHFGVATAVALAVPKALLWYLQLRHLAHAFELFYQVPYQRAGNAVAAHVLVSGSLFAASAWGLGLLIGHPLVG